MKSPGEYDPHEGLPSPPTPDHDVPKSSEICTPQTATPSFELSARLEELRALPVVLDTTYVPAVENAFQYVRHGVRATTQKLVYHVAPGKHPRRIERQITSAILGHERVIPLKQDVFLDRIPAEGETAQDLLSSRLDTLLECLEVVRMHNTQLKLGDCFNAARSLGLIPNDPREAALFEELFKDHSRVTIEDESERVWLADKPAIPPTIGQAVDGLWRRTTTVTVNREQVLAEQCVPDRWPDAATASGIKRVLALDTRFEYLGDDISLRPIYKLSPERADDTHDVERLQAEAAAIVTRLQAPAAIMISIHRMESAIRRVAYSRQQFSLLSLLVEAHPQVQRIRTDSGDYCFWLQPAATEESRSQPAALGDTPQPVEASLEAKPPEPPTPQPELTTERAPGPPEPESSAEMLRNTPIRYDTTYQAAAEMLLSSLPNGIYTPNGVIETLLTSKPGYLVRTARDRHLAATALLLQPRVMRLKDDAHAAELYYVTSASDDTLPRVERFIDYLVPILSAEKTLGWSSCRKLAQDGFLPEGQSQIELFWRLFRGHLRVDAVDKHVRAVSADAPQARPQTIGEALDRLVASSRKRSIFTASRFREEIFGELVLDEAIKAAFTTALSQDERFESTMRYGERLFSIRRDDRPEGPRPELADISAEAQEQHQDRLQRLSRAIIKEVIDEETIWMTTAHILDAAQRMSSFVLSDHDKTSIIKYLEQNSRLRRPHPRSEVMHEKSIPFKYRVPGPEEPPKVPLRGNLIDLNKLPTIEYRRIQRIEQLLAMYEKRRVELIEMEKLAADNDAEKARQQRKNQLQAAKGRKALDIY